MNRREMLMTAGAGAAALLLPKFALADDKPAGYTVPKLPYEYDALEPIIDKMTMTIHHDKHHKAYVDNLNKAVAGTDLAGMPIDELMKKVKEVPQAKRTAIINNGGGHYNHTFFWTIMAPKGQGGEPSEELKKAIEGLGGMDKFKQEVTAKGLTRFGSGWVWAVVDKDGKLKVESSPNQNCPLSAGSTPILGIDVWEHAYYLKYQNRRGDYLKAWWDVANWKQINENFAKAHKA